MQTNAVNIIEFLTSLVQKGLSYNSINVARSALSSFVLLKRGSTVGTHPLISRFMKGVFNKRPPAPRYNVIWDVNVVLDFLRKLSPANTLTLKQLTLKLVMLIALITAQRSQTIYKLKISNLQLQENKASFHITDFIKQSRPGHTGFTVILQGYPVDRRLCVIHYLKYYLDCTNELRRQNGVAEDQLFISFKKPHTAVSKDTISRWIGSVMEQSGVDVTQFRPHSTRAASTSAANKLGVPIKEIMCTAGWSKAETFQRFYNKPLTQEGSCMVGKLLQKR